MRKEGERLARTVWNKEDVNVTLWSLLSTGKGTKKPSFQDGLRLKILCNLLCHYRCTHIFHLLQNSGNLHPINVFSTRSVTM